MTDETQAPAEVKPATPAEEPSKKKAFGALKKLGFWGQLRELFGDVFSPDPATRRMGRYFVLSLIGIVSVFVATGFYIKQVHEEVRAKLAATGEQGKNLDEFLVKQAEEARRKFKTQSLGQFTIEIKAPDGQTKPPHGVMNLADLDVVVECDSKETCEFVEERMPQIRNLLTNIFTPMDRDELLSKEGKKRLKKRIIDKLNGWIPRGKIQDLYFDKLVIS